MKYVLKNNMDGITAVIINRKDNSILFLKRRNLPFIVNPGIFSLVSGKRKKGEHYLDTAYREIYEETKLSKENLELVKQSMITVTYKNYYWKNKLFVFISNKTGIKLNIESSAYKWIPYKKIPSGYLKTFIEKERIQCILNSILSVEQNLYINV